MRASAQHGGLIRNGHLRGFDKFEDPNPPGEIQMTVMPKTSRCAPRVRSTKFMGSEYPPLRGRHIAHHNQQREGAWHG